MSAQHLAARAGVDILRRGGNAIDAAVATGYAEAVVNPCCGNIGGGGFLTAHFPDGRDIFLNFREMAPAASTRDMYLDGAGQRVPGASVAGWKSVAVPGTVLGLDTALVKYGSMPREVVMAEAIRLAREGFVLTTADADILARGTPLLRQDATAARIFLHSDGSPLLAGERLRQTELAATLQAIAIGGPDAFYKDHVPNAVASASGMGGGIVTAADFAAYHLTESTPLTCIYRGHTVMSAPPPSSGGTAICEALNILEGYDLKGMGFHSAGAVHVMTEAFRRAFYDRNTLLGDPAFVPMPLTRLLSTDYAVTQRAQISDRATPSASLRSLVVPSGEKPETTHFSVMDKMGGAVSVTYTINGGFGAGVVAGDTGFLLNDQMDDFTTQSGAPNQYGLVQAEPNIIAPGKRPLSSMAPTIVLRDGTVKMVLGSPGGPAIITSVVQTILNMIDFGMDAQEAVDAPRVHAQWLPDVLYAEPFALSPDTRALLEQMGHRIQERKPWGAVALIAAGIAGNKSAPAPDSVATHATLQSAYYGANDSRRAAGIALAP